MHGGFIISENVLASRLIWEFERLDEKRLASGSSHRAWHCLPACIPGCRLFLLDRLAIDYTDAAMLIASAADVRAALAGNPPYTMRAAIPRSMLSV